MSRGCDPCHVTHVTQPLASMATSYIQLCWSRPVVQFSSYDERRFCTIMSSVDEIHDQENTTISDLFGIVWIFSAMVDNFFCYFFVHSTSCAKAPQPPSMASKTYPILEDKSTMTKTNFCHRISLPILMFFWALPVEERKNSDTRLSLLKTDCKKRVLAFSWRLLNVGSACRINKSEVIWIGERMKFSESCTNALVVGISKSNIELLPSTILDLIRVCSIAKQDLGLPRLSQNAKVLKCSHEFRIHTACCMMEYMYSPLWVCTTWIHLCASARWLYHAAASFDGWRNIFVHSALLALSSVPNFLFIRWASFLHQHVEQRPSLEWTIFHVHSSIRYLFAWYVYVIFSLSSDISSRSNECTNYMDCFPRFTCVYDQANGSDER